MGVCLSTPSATTNTRTNNNGGAHEKKRKHRNEQSLADSMVRVGSMVLKEVPDKHKYGSTHLEPSRASSYDHVHELVMTHFEGHDVLRRKAGIVGLQNLGNTCFLNSSLQCLSNTIPLTDYFLGYNFRNEINHDNTLGTRGNVVTAYAFLMKQMWTSQRQNMDPTHFKNQLDKFAPQFKGNMQHDAQEVLAFLLDGLHEDLNRVKGKKPYMEDKDCDGTNNEGDAIMAWQNYLQRNRSIIVDLFQGQLRNTMKCQRCGHVNIRFEPFMYLSLPISQECMTLDDCLNLYSAQEYMSGDNQWYCSKCKRHVNATKKLDLWMLPPILIVHLKRFHGTRKNKIGTAIHYPIETWNLQDAVKTKSGLYPQYALYAVSNHHGDLHGGHYTAYCKNRFTETWHEMNDSSTRHVSREYLQNNPKAYCLFYNRVERQEPTRNTKHQKNNPKIMRQSADRPELWPHMQIQTTDYRDFQRSSIVH